MNYSPSSNQPRQQRRKDQEKSAHRARYMPGLDGLRALAVGAVIAYHLNLTWAPGGLLGVCLFFVLSGYLITDILLAQWQRCGCIDLRDFWLRRVRRLMPALFALLAAVLVWAVCHAPSRLASLGREALAAVCYVSNWRLIFHHASYFESFGPPSPLGHLWSLAVEAQFYLLWPPLLILGLRLLRRRPWVAAVTAALALASTAAMALLYVPGLDPSRVYYGTDTRAFALLIGAVLAFVWPSRRLSAHLSGGKRLALDAAGGAGLLVVLWMIAQTNAYQPFLYQGGLLLFSLAAAAVVAALAHPASRLGELAGIKPLRWLGALSYGIYLWHYPIIALTSPAVNTGGISASRALGQIAASIVLAALSYYLIEVPIRSGKWERAGRREAEPRRWRKMVAISGKIASVSLTLILCTSCLGAAGSPLANGDRGAAATDATDVSEAGTHHQDEGGGTDQTSPESGEDDPGGSRTEQDDPSKGENDPGDQADAATGQGSEISGTEITAIGDSVMLDIEPVLQQRLPGIVIDGKIGRQMHQAPDVISQLQADGNIRSIVIVELGTNGSFTAKQLTKTLDSLAGAKQIVLVNTRVPKSWQNEVNQTLAKAAEAYPQVQLVNWYATSSGHDEYFDQDGVHLTPTGAKAYGEMVIAAISRTETK